MGDLAALGRLARRDRGGRDSSAYRTRTMQQCDDDDDDDDNGARTLTGRGYKRIRG